MPRSTGSAGAPADPGGRSVNVLIVSHYFPPHVGGIENVAREQARHLAAAGLSVAVLTSTIGPAGPGAADDLAGEGYELTRVPAWGGLERRGVPFPLFSPSLVWRAFGQVRRAEVVHVHDVEYLSSWVTALFCRLLRRPLLVTQHVEIVSHPAPLVGAVQRAVFRTAGRYVLATAARVTVLNSRVRDFVTSLGVASERVRLLPNGVDTAMFFPVREEDKAALRARFGLPPGNLALFVGRFVPKKGFTRLLEAASDDYTLVLAGGEPPVSLEGDERFVFLGPVDRAKIGDLYRACDLFVLPSEAEGFPLTVQEAMASGLPVITTDDPGYDLYGLDRDGVRLIETTTEAVRRALGQLATDRPTRARMAEYSLAFARAHFAWPAHVAGLLREYGALLEGAPPAETPVP